MASRFWVGGTGTCDGVDLTHISATSGGAGGASFPGASDTFTFDASSGGGTVTPSTNLTVQSLACGAFTGSLDWSVNNNNVTCSTSGGMSISGTGTRTIKLGSGTFTLSSASAASLWNAATTTNLTFDAGTSNIVFSATSSAVRTFAGGGLTYSSVTCNANTSKGLFSISGANTFTNLTINGSNALQLASSVTQTVTGTLTLNGASGSLISINSAALGTAATISKASGSVTATYCGIEDLTCTGGATFAATSSYDLGRNTGITITEPSGGGTSSARMIGG